MASAYLSLSPVQICGQQAFLGSPQSLGCLIQLRGDTLERKVWVDAICINQDNIPERNRQVRMMPHIYSRAESVLVWFGTFPPRDS